MISSSALAIGRCREVQRFALPATSPGAPFEDFRAPESAVIKGSVTIVAEDGTTYRTVVISPSVWIRFIVSVLVWCLRYIQAAPVGHAAADARVSKDPGRRRLEQRNLMLGSMPRMPGRHSFCSAGP